MSDDTALICRFKYYMTIAVFANNNQAIERPFCIDTCVLEHTRSIDGRS